MSHFVDYCNEIESARKNGFGRVVLPAEISLPDICGKIEYPDLSGNKNVGERYKKWVQTFLKGVCPIESTLECLECQRNNTSEKFSCGDSCQKQDETYDRGIAQLAIRLYQLRNNVTHEGNLQGDHYLFDLAYSDAEFPIQMQSFTDGKWSYGKAVVNLGVLINALCLNAIRYYENADAEKKAKLDDFDKEIFHSDNFSEAFQRMEHLYD
ncbi:MAG: hypothetical protein Q4C64_02820 [Erysipelotrichia bacterium]|nr:hypothetical protein [Erysipelotrichia bacterium]